MAIRNSNLIAIIATCGIILPIGVVIGIQTQANNAPIKSQLLNNIEVKTDNKTSPYTALPSNKVILNSEMFKVKKALFESKGVKFDIDVKTEGEYAVEIFVSPDHILTFQRSQEQEIYTGDSLYKMLSLDEFLSSELYFLKKEDQTHVAINEIPPSDSSKDQEGQNFAIRKSDYSSGQMVVKFNHSKHYSTICILKGNNGCILEGLVNPESINTKKLTAKDFSVFRMQKVSE